MRARSRPIAVWWTSVARAPGFPAGAITRLRRGATAVLEPPSSERLAAGAAVRAGVTSREALVFLAALWLAGPGNLPFWSALWRATGGLRDDNALFFLSLPLFALAWTHFLLSLVAWGRATRPALAAVLVSSAFAAYFMQTYGMLLDHGMIASIAQTHAAEALDLLSWRMAAWVLAFGAIPALVIARLRVAAGSWKRELGIKLLAMAAAAACLAILALGQYQSYASLARNHRELRLLLLPGNIASSVHGYLKRRLATPVALAVTGADASRAVPAGAAARPRLTLLVIGETARAANFSLNGYPRPTNPELAQRDVLFFSNVSSCGTSTAVSLPCMFLDAGRAGFEDSLVSRREGLLDVLQHAGIAVRWRDNNAGCKGVCDRVPRDDLAVLQVQGLCNGGECWDEILLRGLQEQIDGLHGDSVIVLHMMGSHGPAYFKRYPPAFEVFKPVCHSVDLDRCTRESILNAYDNTLRYTDHVLAQAIGLLARNGPRFDTALLYVSDHGESLGENGIYLHGIPYALAPREQVHVPMLLWLSEGMRADLDVDPACLKSRQREALSHDNLFHSVLGLNGVRTSVYRNELDFLRPCRT